MPISRIELLSFLAGVLADVESPSFPSGVMAAIGSYSFSAGVIATVGSPAFLAAVLARDSVRLPCPGVTESGGSANVAVCCRSLCRMKGLAAFLVFGSGCCSFKSTSLVT